MWVLVADLFRAFIVFPFYVATSFRRFLIGAGIMCFHLLTRKFHIKPATPVRDIFKEWSDPTFSPSPRCASAIQIVRPWNQTLRHSPTSNRFRDVDHFRRRFARFKLGAHVLQAHSKRVNLLLLSRNHCPLLLYFAVLFEKLVEQHRVHRFVAHSVRFSFFIGQHQRRIHFRNFFGAKLGYLLDVAFVVEREAKKRLLPSAVLNPG